MSAADPAPTGEYNRLSGVTKESDARRTRLSTVTEFSESQRASEATTDARPRVLSFKFAMNVGQKVLLTPIQKFRRFRRPPWKLFLHCSLLVLTSLYALTVSVNEAAYLRSMDRTWKSVLFPSDYSFTDGDVSVHLAGVADLFDSLDRAVYNYYHLTANAVPQLRLVGRHTHGECLNFSASFQQLDLILPPTLKVKRYDNAYYPTSEAFQLEQGVPVAEALGVDMTNASAWLDSVSRLILDFDSCNDCRISMAGTSCYIWSVESLYDLADGAGADLRLVYRMDTGGTTCENVPSFEHYVARAKGALELSIVLVAGVLGLLLLRALWQAGRVYQRVRRSHGVVRANWIEMERQPLVTSPAAAASPRRRSLFAAPPSDQTPEATEALGLPEATHVPEAATIRWGDLPLGVRRRFFPHWEIFALVAVVLTLYCFIDSLVKRSDHSRDSAQTKLTRGCAYLTQWWSFMGFLKPYPQFYQIILTLRAGMFFLFSCLCVAVPCFFAFVFVGTSWFGYEVENFKSVHQTSATLFSVFNGDSVLDIFMQVERYFPISGQIYQYSLICLFMYVVLNTVIATIEEAFFNARSFQRSLQPLLRETVKSEDSRLLAQPAEATSLSRGPWHAQDGPTPPAAVARAPAKSSRAADAPPVDAGFWGSDYAKFVELLEMMDDVEVERWTT